MAKLAIGNYIVLFDDADIPIVESYTWIISKHGQTNYALTVIDGKVTSMHKLIMSNGNPLLVIDHIDNNGLNNCRSNLRLITWAQNSGRRRIGSRNTSGYKGVSYVESRNKYQATIQAGGKSINLGRFDNIEEAAKVYEEAAKKHYGEYFDHHKLEQAQKLNIKQIGEEREKKKKISRLANRLEQLNDPEFKGVTYRKNYKGPKKWRARITINGKLIHLGDFATEKEAANMYNLALSKHLFDSALLNLFKE